MLKSASIEAANSRDDAGSISRPDGRSCRLRVGHEIQLNALRFKDLAGSPNMPGGFLRFLQIDHVDVLRKLMQGRCPSAGQV